MLLVMILMVLFQTLMHDMLCFIVFDYYVHYIGCLWYLKIIYTTVNCSSMGSCLLFMPRIDLWAIESQNQTSEECGFFLNEEQYPKDGIIVKDGLLGGRENHSYSDQSKSTKRTVFQDESLSSASYAWSSFVEQVESLSTPLMILVCSLFVVF